MRRVLWACGAVAVSALLLRYGGMGLHPVPGLLLLAPLPVLLLAPRVNATTAVVAAFLAWLLGGIDLWAYYTATLEQPVPVAVGLLAGSALVFAGLVAVTRALLRRGRYVSAALVLPAGWVALEYVVSLATPFGTWWSIAYTQADARALLQLSALTGHWGVTFVALGVPAAIAAVAAPGAAGRVRVRLGIAVLIVATLVMGYGAWASAGSTGEGERVRVAALAVTQPPEYLPVDTPAGRIVIAELVREIGRLADSGAQVVVLPEKSLRANEKTLPLLTGPLGMVARERGIHVVAGLVLARNGTSVNAAIDLPSGAVYAKHLLIPGLEDDLEPGDRRVLVPGRRWALAVCFDLEKADLIRAYRRDGARLLLVPALDFERDAWLHSRMAVTRGVEYGLGVVRAAQLGSLTISDARGRVVAEQRATVTSTASIVADLPADPALTPYARFGDWFAWLCIALVLAGSLAVGRPRPLRTER
ncbi:nitrilase-related carbon-nitrogen hydrolase [Flindersiella endophytica]